MKRGTTAPTTDAAPSICAGCLLSSWNAEKGLFGGFDCNHPEAVNRTPKLALMILEDPPRMVCKLGGFFYASGDQLDLFSN